ncbi:SDR family NAD(P)-dependent oxidoreductase [Bariatricus massiliensis]|uniref:SDR family NAD(P)-dependent oxidoreductase n=1 Tax=Bariatricus massiliensis TaxID=1745713 RepID=A0ABS8DJ37_9FIRM|nr:SDR family NAD(P)-dependent oxidoreductase [Bariatricus massiliensis]MCB7304640.1 SDR family NAD(P)-dependent oxidoreductase [Bariatricus massiliensis]MCB7374791.1 SDR family NAD(P)-dependent oxidoreductase [Bariatricus massiliensis]MCB7388082.1 SDR family NAD(P)-dependent oxidoreductase [Bariatricus massiliensis]MCB7411956.1 SDR family NAD(P)-dependent oxidoreductase [Bariatricus massiliensis]MCQ5254253.1 SDR family NAD(P)-dependent oxidoreductase [Bariatricus massiliensis]
MNKKTVLITGASRGIGKATALLFAAGGYHVFLNCRKTWKDLHQVKSQIDSMQLGSCEIVTGDVGNPEDVRGIFDVISLSCAGLDVLINNAGVAYMGLLSEMSDGDWSQVISTNLSSVFYCCRQAIPHMVKVKRGRIINVSSMWGTAGASCEAAYSASKSGIHGLTRALAKELAPSNIQVNAIACGVIDTAMNQTLDETEKAALREEIPAGRFGTPDEAAQMIWDIANAPEYMTGQIIGFDGGFL